MTSGAPPRVAVLVPTHNRADLLPDALESVVQQTYGDWEAIVVDDASTDGSHAIACAFAERYPDRIRAMRRDRRGGVGAARTTAVNASCGGELLCLLDHDDLLRERYLTRMVEAYDEAVRAGRRVGVVACDGSFLTTEGLTGETWYGRYGVADPIDLDSMIRRNEVFPRALFARAAYEHVGDEFSSDCLGFDDYDLWLRLLEAGYEAVIVREALAIYRDHDASYSWNRVARAEGAIATYRRALGRGALSARQRRAVRRQILHYRASLEWELLRRSLRGGGGPAPARVALRAIPLALAAFAQQPHRWASWSRRLWREARELAAYRSSTNP
jgi:glycosyltransferase involved in cell wall biosynthesis